MVRTDVGTVEKRIKNIQKTLFWLYEEIYSMEVCIVVFVWKLDIFSFHLLCRSLYKSKKIKRYYQVELTRSRYFHAFKNDTKFTRDPASHFVPSLWSTLSWQLDRDLFEKKNDGTFKHCLSLWEFLLARQIVARLTTSFSWINENFGKLFEKKR